MKILLVSVSFMVCVACAASSTDPNTRAPTQISKFPTIFEHSDDSLPACRKFLPEDEISEKPWSPLIRFLKDMDFPTNIDFGL
jgi:hypothetical protein